MRFEVAYETRPVLFLHYSPSPRSIQNAIMVTRSSRFPLMVDPQGQALRWIKTREQERISMSSGMAVTTLSNPRLKDCIEFTMGEGLVLVMHQFQ